MYIIQCQHPFRYLDQGDSCVKQCPQPHHFSSGFIHLLNIVERLATTPITCYEQSHGSNSHDATAALAVVLHLLALIQTFTCRQAGVSGRTAVSQFRKVAELSVVEFICQYLLLLAGLRVVPVKIRSSHIFLWLSADASHIATCHSHQHTTCCEQRPLCVIADQSLAVRSQVELRDTLAAILRKDTPAGHELHRITQRIACRTCHQRATDAVFRPQLQVLLSLLATLHEPTDEINLFLCLWRLSMRSFWHFREMATHSRNCILQSRLFHMSRLIARHDGTRTAYSSPAMDIGISVLLRQVFHLVNELMHSLYRLWCIHIADGEAKIGGVAGQQLAIRPHLTLFGEVNLMIDLLFSKRNSILYHGHY